MGTDPGESRLKAKKPDWASSDPGLKEYQESNPFSFSLTFHTKRRGLSTQSRGPSLCLGTLGHKGCWLDSHRKDVGHYIHPLPIRHGATKHFTSPSHHRLLTVLDALKAEVEMNLMSPCCQGPHAYTCRDIANVTPAKPSL